jgi:hypothetical protein
MIAINNLKCIYYDRTTTQCSKLLRLFGEYGYPCTCTNLNVYIDSEHDGHCDYYKEKEANMFELEQKLYDSN